MDSFGMTRENDYSAELARPTFDSQDSGELECDDARQRGVPAKLQKLLSEDLWALFNPSQREALSSGQLGLHWCAVVSRSARALERERERERERKKD